MTLASAVSLGWHTARGLVHLDRPVLVGIANVTPDSFWDGGRHQAVDAAVRHAARLLEEGAALLDIGGESTRPGAAPVPAHEEQARVVPVVDALVRRWPDVPVSVDTVKASTAQAALAAGAAVINDVSGLRLDPGMGDVVAAAGAGVILMHSRGGVDRMARYDLAAYGSDPVGEIVTELGMQVEHARTAGVRDDAIVVDPGLGFAKRSEHSLAALAQLARVGALGLPVLVGPSRKRFIGEAAGGLPAAERLEGSIAACVVALLHGARLFRVHDVAATRRALDVAAAICAARGAE